MNSLMLLPSGSGGALAMQEELAAVTVAVAFIEIHATAAAAGSDGAEPLCRRRMQLHTSEVPHARLQLCFAAAAFVQVDVDEDGWLVGLCMLKYVETLGLQTACDL